MRREWKLAVIKYERNDERQECEYAGPCFHNDFDCFILSQKLIFVSSIFDFDGSL